MAETERKPMDEQEYTTYPRQFPSYRWYKPLLVGLLFVVFMLVLMFAADFISTLIFGVTADSAGYDDMDLYTAAGAFKNCLMAIIPIPALFLAAGIVRDRPISSYLSSMGGWRWKIFARTFAAAFVIMGIPTIIQYLVQGRTGDIRFTLGGFLILTVLAPFQGFAEELTYRGYMMQTVSSWFRLPAAGVIVQLIFFTLVHPYNLVGVIAIAVSALIYALVCIFSRGLEAGTALHIVNNMTEIYMAGFGFGMITAEQTVGDSIFNIALKVLFFVFILYAQKKLHWFDAAEQEETAETVA